MADETVVAQQAHAPQTVSGVDNAAQGVTLKPSAIEPSKKKLNPATDPETSDLPYHTANTEKIQADRTKELQGKGKQPYKYQFNGYTVVEVEQANPLATDEKFANTIWKVTADDASGFEQSFNNQRAAEIFVETHSPQFAKNAAIKTPTALKDTPTT